MFSTTSHSCNCNILYHCDTKDKKVSQKNHFSNRKLAVLKLYAVA